MINTSEESMSCFSETTTRSTKSPENDDVSLSLLYNLSTIQDRIHRIQSLVSFFMISTNNNNHNSSMSTYLPVANVGSLVQEIITIASSMMFTCQQLQNSNDIDNNQTAHAMVMELSRQEIDHDQDLMLESTNFLGAQEIGFSEKLDWQGTKNLNPNRHFRPEFGNYEVLELGVSDLLAKYTHHCTVCGKGFKRDANLRMHMRAHGDEFKTREALISPTSNHGEHSTTTKKKHYYSCPQQGCRWNQRHEKFQPLKSVTCAKNHYKRSHCPKTYMCRRCNVKYFSVLSDLRTHEKHCGDIKWVCSCGTRFSRKDKLVSHVSLFLGHSSVAHVPSQMQPPMRDDY